MFVIFEFCCFIYLTTNFEMLFNKFSLVQNSSYTDTYNSFIKYNFRKIPPPPDAHLLKV